MAFLPVNCIVRQWLPVPVCGCIIHVDLPPEVGNQVKGVFTLLHGFSNDGDDWVHFPAAIRYAADNGLVLVIPDAGNSFLQRHGLGAGLVYVADGRDAGSPAANGALARGAGEKFHCRNVDGRLRCFAHWFGASGAVCRRGKFFRLWICR